MIHSHQIQILTCEPVIFNCLNGTGSTLARKSLIENINDGLSNVQRGEFLSKCILSREISSTTD